MKQEEILINGKTFYKTEDEKYKVKNVETGNVYDVAIDIKLTKYTLTRKLKEKENEY